MTLFNYILYCLLICLSRETRAETDHDFENNHDDVITHTVYDDDVVIMSTVQRCSPAFICGDAAVPHLQSPNSVSQRFPIAYGLST